jgi:ABC-type uncharacterized transport system substrate-binding protein
MTVISSQLSVVGENVGTKLMSEIISAWLLATVLLATVSFAAAQQTKKVPRIGFVSGSGDSKSPASEAFRQGLRELGYIEGRNILVEYDRGVLEVDQFPGHMTELLQLNVDVIVVVPFPAIRAAKQVTKTIPIVMVTTQDPVETGFVDSLARPGGNITGITMLTRDLSGKRLELLKEVVPRISRVGVLWDPDTTGSAIAIKEYEVAADALKIQLQSLKVRSPNPDIEGAFRALKGRASGVVPIRGRLLNRYTKRIADLAIKNRLPSMHERSNNVEAGGLMSYASADAESFRRAAWYVDKILKGAKPADLPIEQPTKFELVINLKTAKQIGVTIPPNVLARADKVIK